ncbi:MAG: hypothetical protein LBV69_09390 [Bacteroidales bacterium]|jgi:predicted transcriptional regulator|nr:hypothetical protein [Bacteroidales bacterium]
MKIFEISKIIEGKVKTKISVKVGNEEFKNAFSSDLMSDVLRITSENTILITGLCNVQTIRTAEMAEIKLIILARGKKVDETMIKLAEENEITIIETEYSIFRVSGELYKSGILPIY